MGAPGATCPPMFSNSYIARLNLYTLIILPLLIDLYIEPPFIKPSSYASVVHASSDQINKVFIVWYVWTYIRGQITASLTLYYVSIDQKKLLSLSLLVCANLSVAMSTNLVY
jgi:hypothetical protein